MLADAAPQLHLVLNKSEVQLGHSISAKLYGIDLQQKLANIDLQALEESFGLIVDETTEGGNDSRWTGQSLQMMKLTLYPRLTGKLMIPSLHADHAQSETQTIEVMPGIKPSRNGNTQIEREIYISTSHPWERQQIVIVITVSLADHFVSLRSKDLHLAGFEIYPVSIGASQQEKKGVTELKFGWALFPLSAGQYHLDLPPIELQKSGQTLRTYFFPKQTITVKALPPYIPPTMPVGKIDISSLLESDNLLFPHRLYFWDVILTGNGVSPNWLPPVLRQIHSNSDIRFLPANTLRTPTTGRKELQSQMTYHIPFKSTANGSLNLPNLHIQYFDPDSAKIVTTTHQPPSAFVFSTTWRSIIGFFLCLVILWAGKINYAKLRSLQIRKRLRRSALLELNNASSYADIRNALTSFSHAEGWPPNLTLRDWAQHWHRHFKVNESFDTLIDQLSHASYAIDPSVDLETLRAALLVKLQMG